MEPLQDKALVEALDILSENLQLVIDQLKDGKNTRADHPDFEMTGFWSRLGLTFNAVSTEATKITMAFSSPPCPDAQEAAPLISGIEKSSLTLLSCFYSLPVTKGKTLHNKLHRTIITILTSVQGLVHVIKTEGVDGSKRQLHSAGGVWEYCDSFPKLPKNNKDAVLFSARQNIELVNDALEEISSAAADDPNDDISQSSGDNDSWSEEDRALLPPSLGLIKAARSCIKKVTVSLRDNGQCDTELQIGELDELDGLLEQVSPAVDDFVLSLYPPTKTDAVKEECHHLSSVLFSLLSQAKNMHITTEADNSWLDFMSKAVQHNFDKLKELLP